MDHYKLLGVHRNASKDEIKKAFRKLAMKFHPDKHADSPKHVKDSATLRFKQLSEAYEILVDDQKRIDYNIGCRSSNYYSSSKRGSYGYGYGYASGYSRTGGANRGRSGTVTLSFGVLLRFFTTRSFLLNAAFAGLLVGGTYIIDASRDRLWKTQNSGKSFEEAMESIKQAKASKDKK